MHPIKIKERENMNCQGRSKAKKYRLDIIVILSLVAISLAALLAVTMFREEGYVAIVEIDGVKIGEYSLLINGEFSLNNGTNVLVVENGVAYLNYSNCPDHTCEKTGKIRFVGQTIVCLPNKLSVTIRGNSQDGVDFVS